MHEMLSQGWTFLQGKLFRIAEKELGILSDKHKQLITAIEFAQSHKFIRNFEGCVGRPEHARVSIAHAFIAKAIFNISQTKTLITWLNADSVLRQICGWETKSSIPSESTFSRAFAEFAKNDTASKIHEAFVIKYHGDKITMHISRDSTEIVAREKMRITETKVQETPALPKKRRRPKKGSIQVPSAPNRLEKQCTMSIIEMLRDLPKKCDVGSKKDSKGYKHSWLGFKLHIDTADGDIPISAVLTSASVHDSQVAMPLSIITQSRITHLYEVMDAAYDAQIIRDFVRSTGKVALIDYNNRRCKDEDKRHFAPHEAERYKVRSSAERVNSNLKDNFAGVLIRVKGHAKVLAHLMFSLLSITINQTMKLVT